MNELENKLIKMIRSEQQWEQKRLKKWKEP